jgi:hypothetical protein
VTVHASTLLDRLASVRSAIEEHANDNDAVTRCVGVELGDVHELVRKVLDSCRVFAPCASPDLLRV